MAEGTVVDGLAKDQGAAFDRFAEVVDLPMTVLTVAWLPVLVVPLFVHVHGSVASSLDVIDYAIWALFALEYLAKLWLAKRRWTFVRGHVLDLVVVMVPFLRPLRAARLLRLIRGVTVFGDVLGRARRILMHKGLHVVLLSALTLVVLGAALVTLAEQHAKGSNIHDFGQGLWWAVVTITTVGYGDKYPVTPFGQGVAIFLMVLGIGLIGVITASIASFFVEESKSGREDEIVERLERIERALIELSVGRSGQLRDVDGAAEVNVQPSSPSPL